VRVTALFFRLNRPVKNAHQRHDEPEATTYPRRPGVAVAALAAGLKSSGRQTDGESIASAAVRKCIMIPMPDTNELRPARTASTIALIAAVWLFFSPWIYDAYITPDAFNCWTVGALIFLFADLHIMRPESVRLSWLNTGLGTWTFASPWIFGYTAATGRFVNSLCVGVLVFFAGLVGAEVIVHRRTHASPRV
jgi:hypothetical protein